MKRLLTKDFWIEYLTIYISIITVTITIQIVILQLDILLLVYCLAKSIFTTIPNVVAIMYGRSKKVINKNKFREALLFVTTSFPYLEVFLIFGYESNKTIIDWEKMSSMICLYIVAYFLMGLYNRQYLQAIKKIVIISINPQKTVQRTVKKIKEKNRSAV